MKRTYFNIFVLIVFCLSGYELSTARHIKNPQKEFIEAFHTALNYISNLMGNGITEEYIEKFEMGTKLEEVRLEIEHLIPKHGYKVEKYNVVTEDGYILTLFRIPSSGRPVLLMHGLAMSSDDWVTPGPDNGIAYLLANEGLDVWLGNVRGNKHCLRHVRLSPHSADFWDFSWDEMGRYDVPATIDYILNVTQHSQLMYVGHSQGGGTFFIMGAERPDYSKKVSLMIGLAPTSTVKHLKNPFVLLLKHFIPLPKIIAIAIAFIGKANTPLVFIDKLIKVFANLLCGRFEITRRICSNYVFWTAGYELSNLNLTTLPTVLSHSPADGAPGKLLEHYLQTMLSGKFTKFNYGVEKNEILYGARTPPVYDVGSVTTPKVIFYSSHDWLVAEPDSFYLRRRLNNVVDYYRVPDYYTHLDFMYGLDIKKSIFPKVMQFIKTINT